MKTNHVLDCIRKTVDKLREVMIALSLSNPEKKKLRRIL